MINRKKRRIKSLRDNKKEDCFDAASTAFVDNIIYWMMTNKRSILT